MRPSPRHAFVNLLRRMRRSFRTRRFPERNAALVLVLAAYYTAFATVHALMAL